MEPLDLRSRPPRGPREMLDGLMMMPRTIDKIRAALPGGNLGEYKIAPGISAIMLAIIGVELEELTRVVAGAANDEEVAEWLRSRADTSRYAEANARMSSLRDADVPPAHRALFESLYPQHLREQNPVNFDLIEADDREMFAAGRR